MNYLDAIKKARATQAAVTSPTVGSLLVAALPSGAVVQFHRGTGYTSATPSAAALAAEDWEVVRNLAPADIPRGVLATASLATADPKPEPSPAEGSPEDAQELPRLQPAPEVIPRKKRREREQGASGGVSQD